MNIIVADIDGCCLSCDHRLHLYHAKDYDGFHELAHMDTPIEQGCVIYRKLLADRDFTVLFVTARWESQRAATLDSLRKYVSPLIESRQLLMRPDDQPAVHGPSDPLFKPSLLMSYNYRIEDVFLAFDDSTTIVQGWRELGVTAYQTLPGINH